MVDSHASHSRKPVGRKCPRFKDTSRVLSGSDSVPEICGAHGGLHLFKHIYVAKGSFCLRQILGYSSCL